MFGFILTFCSSSETMLTQMQNEGELRIVTRNAPTTYYEGPKGDTGLEYDLAKRFADELGVQLKIVQVDNFTDILPMVTEQKVHLAAAGLLITNERKVLVQFGPAYQTIKQQFIYLKNTPTPTSLEELETKHTIHVIDGNGVVEQLKHLQRSYPKLTWQAHTGIESHELLEQIAEKKIMYAIVASNEVAQMRQFYPDLDIAFELPDEQKIAWAFPRFGQDNSLYVAAIQFFNRLKYTGELEQLIERYYGHIDVEDFNDILAKDFYRHIKERLPTYRKDFELIAARYNMDWQLLAAMAYQESNWDPDAVSHTGVRGIMMLTESAAMEVGVVDRDDPLESILGGTKYFIQLKERFDATIEEPDRTWLALAAYNVGLGHLNDAQKITKQRGGNANRWADVKKSLPLLTKRSWYTKTAHGYARGYEPVKFVKLIRRFYEILRYLDNEQILPNRRWLNKYVPWNKPLL